MHSFSSSAAVRVAHWLVLGIAAVPTSAVAEPVNAVLGDASWVEAHGSAPEAKAPEQARIQTHLRFVLRRLRSADPFRLDAATLARRDFALDVLEAYAERGIFPRRPAADGWGERRPRFIDDRGVRCAVGAMIAGTGFAALAADIGARFEYAFVPEIESPELLRWADDFGFTARDLAAIQPAYGFVEPVPVPRSRTEELVSSMAEVCEEELGEGPETGERCAEVLLQIRYGGGAPLSVRAPDGTGPFYRAWLESLVASRELDFSLGEEVRLAARAPSAEELLRWLLTRLTASALRQRCQIVPGAIVDRVRLTGELRSSGLRLEVDSEPPNPEMGRCIEGVLREVAGLLLMATRGEPLEVRINLERPAYVTSRLLEAALLRRGPSLAEECGVTGVPLRITVRGERDRALEIDIAGGPSARRRCLRRRLAAALPQALTSPHVGRWRLDGDVDAAIVLDREGVAQPVSSAPPEAPAE